MCSKTYKSELFNSVLDIGQSSGRFDKNRDENLTFAARPRIAKLYDKQSNAISRNKDNCFGNISVLKRKPIWARYAVREKKENNCYIAVCTYKSWSIISETMSSGNWRREAIENDRDYLLAHRDKILLSILWLPKSTRVISFMDIKISIIDINILI